MVFSGKITLRSFEIEISPIFIHSNVHKQTSMQLLHLFYLRMICSSSNTKDMKELETTREVILSMLLRLLEYREVIDLVTIILEESKYCTDDTEKWLRLSEQVGSILLHALEQDKIRISEVDTFVSLRKLFSALNPCVFGAMDEVILMLFQDPRLLVI